MEILEELLNWGYITEFDKKAMEMDEAFLNQWREKNFAYWDKAERLVEKRNKMIAHLQQGMERVDGV